MQTASLMLHATLQGIRIAKKSNIKDAVCDWSICVMWQDFCSHQQRFSSVDAAEHQSVSGLNLARWSMCEATRGTCIQVIMVTVCALSHNTLLSALKAALLRF